LYATEPTYVFPPWQCLSARVCTHSSVVADPGISLSPVILELSRALIRRLVRPRTRTHQCPLYVLRNLFLRQKREKTTKGKGLQRSLLLCFVIVSRPMAVSGDRQHTADPGAQVRAAIEHVLADRHGDWRSSPVGSQALALNYDAPSTLHRFYRCSPILQGGSGWPNHRKPQKMKHGLIRARTSTGMRARESVPIYNRAGQIFTSTSTSTSTSASFRGGRRLYSAGFRSEPSSRSSLLPKRP
jgi:hypothetical protein